MPFPWFGKKEEQQVDPVCGMNVDPKRTAGTHEYQGKTYYFCASGCRVAFAKEPEKYVKGGPAGMGGMGMGHH